MGARSGWSRGAGPGAGAGAKPLWRGGTGSSHGRRKLGSKEGAIMKQSGFWDSAPVGGAARTQNGKEAEERRTGEERQGPGKRNRRGRVRKEESQRQEEGGGRCDELDGRISQRH